MKIKEIIKKTLENNIGGDNRGHIIEEVAQDWLAENLINNLPDPSSDSGFRAYDEDAWLECEGDELAMLDFEAGDYPTCESCGAQAGVAIYLDNSAANISIVKRERDDWRTPEGQHRWLCPACVEKYSIKTQTEIDKLEED